MHKTQFKIIELAAKKNIEKMGPRAIGREIGVKHPQVVVYHLNQLKKIGLLPRKSKAIIEKLRKTINKAQSNLIDVPVLGTANCGIASLLAEEMFEGYLKVSPKLLTVTNYEGLFALRAEGDSMNQANINNTSVEDGDYLVIDTNVSMPKDNDYVLSVIDGSANIKKFKHDSANNRIMLLSESTKNYPPIYIHRDDDYLINGLVVAVIKKP